MKLSFLAAASSLLITSAAMAQDTPPSSHEGHSKPQRYDIFQKMDKNGDGEVSKPEAMAFHEEMFDKMDSNHDGKITKEEGAAFREKRMEERKKQHQGTPQKQ